MRHRPSIRGGCFALLLATLAFAGADRGPAWERHTIDDASRGADGVRLADLDGDGRLDIATGWEEGGQIRVCRNPGPAHVRKRWPAVTVGQVGSPEDAVFVDLDDDGALDVVSCCEGKTRGLFVHWNSSSPLESGTWRTEPIPFAAGPRSWMYALPMQVDGRRGVDLVVGAKGEGAAIGWLESPDQARDLGAWRWHPLTEAGWIMSLIEADMDADGDPDILASDRKGPLRGVFWLENPGAEHATDADWARHPIGGEDLEVMFLDLADLDGDGRRDVVAASHAPTLLLFRPRDDAGLIWERSEINLGPDLTMSKAVAVGDLDLDGRRDLVITFEKAEHSSGVVWASPRSAVTGPDWIVRDLSGPPGTKFDRVELIDLDLDGDLDVLTCEERENLGVFWYENPTLR